MSLIVNLKKPKLILCDIEGTTTDISFVKNVLFPYVRNNVRSYLETNWNKPQTDDDIKLLWEQYLIDLENKEADLPDVCNFSNFVSSTNGPNELIDSIVKYVIWQMNLDKKTTALKQLQGNIWRCGYESGNIKGHVYDDVPSKFKEWSSNGILLAIYSSGSVLAQKLLFAHTDYGDLTKLLCNYFDTKVGPKQDENSYRKIVSILNIPASDILFLTDISKEAKAAIAAEMESVLLSRDGVNLTTEELSQFKHVENFNQLCFD